MSFIIDLKYFVKKISLIVDGDSSATGYDGGNDGATGDDNKGPNAKGEKKKDPKPRVDPDGDGENW